MLHTLLYSNPGVTASKMCLFLLVIFSLISASAAEMSPEFRRCSLQWVNAGQVKVSCNNTLIAQHCDPDQSCRNMSKPGVSLEKDRERVCLTITNCSYDSWSCEARGYIDGKEFGENVTVNVTCNQPASTSTSPDKSHSESIAAGVTLCFIGLIIIGLIIVLCICYKKVRCFRKVIRHIFCRQQSINRTTKKEQDIELEEKSLKSTNIV
ncbi:uncharacterized protein LOC122135124 isoform X4 [Cyprinus carpio]|uniref:Uncharacterized protein LOC122135124 isoform X4 n=1 Tax=Cyprinus carpio TaxID=7962 RepID=A0A9Q9VQX9_CYPCA|nr:uncharacterized protein LOC122135124 isoform X4 [Cyprinus carpio]